MPPRTDKTTDQPTSRRASAKVRNMQVRVDPQGFKAIKVLALDLERSLEDLMVEALNDLMAKHGKKVTIEKRSSDRSSGEKPTMRQLV